MSSLIKMVKSWVAVLLHPGITTAFDEAKRQASKMHTIIGLLILGLVAGSRGIIQGDVGSEAVIAVPLLTIAGFYILSGAMYVLAKVFRGTGNFSIQFYLLSLAIVPTGIVISLLRLVSLIEPLSNLLFLYDLFLEIYAIKSTHSLDIKKSAAVVLIPTVGFLLIPRPVILVPKTVIV